MVLKNTHRMKKENGKIQITDKNGMTYTDQKQEDICLLENAWFFIQLFQKYIIISCWWNLTIMISQDTTTEVRGSCARRMDAKGTILEHRGIFGCNRYNKSAA